MAYPVFDTRYKSLMAKHLSQDTYDTLCDKRTSGGVTLDEVIHSGIQNPDSGVGLYAGDAESYTLFAPLFDSIIQDYHGFSKTQMHVSDLHVKLLDITNPDPTNDYILSTRIRVGRNLKDFALGPSITKENRLSVEKNISSALNSLEEGLSGTYYPLSGMEEKDRVRLVEDHFLFKAGDRFLEAAGLNRDWPSGRGIFHNEEKTFLVWVNEEDQLRIISMQKGGNVKEVFERLVKAIAALETKLTFAYSDHLGYITSCPSNLGTAMRASVHIRLPKLSCHMDDFEAICKAYHLQIRGIHGEHSKSEAGIFDISNKRRLGISESTCVKEMAQGVEALIAKEKSFV